MLQCLLLFAIAATEPRVTTVQDAVRIAQEDMLTLDPLDQEFMRWIWFPQVDKKQMAVTAFSIDQHLSWAAEPYHPVPVAGGVLLRIDLRAIWPQEEDFIRGIRVWESLPSNYFGRRTEELVDVPPYKLNGKTYTKKRQVVDKQFSLHIGLDKYLMLLARTKSNVPIVRYDQFNIYISRTLKGGLYYKFNGFDGQKLTDVLKRFGDTSGVVDSARSDDRAAMFNSGVTDRERLIVIKPTQGVRPSKGNGIAAITFDIAEGDDLVDQDPLANLLKFRFSAGEAILQKPNGKLAFLLFDKDEKIIDFADPSVAHDGTIPFPAPDRLEAAISCVRCHGPHDGYQPFANDIKTLYNNDLKILGDAVSELPYWDTLDLLNGRFSGAPSTAAEPFGPIMVARNFYSESVFRSCGLTIPEASAGLADIFTYYLYTKVDARMACLEVCGVNVEDDPKTPNDETVEAFNLLIPKLIPNDLNVQPEDHRIGAIRAGLKIPRVRFEAIFADLSVRAEAQRIKK